MAYVRDAFDCTTGTCISSVSEVKFYSYFDNNSNGIPDDNNEWILIGAAEHSETIVEQWSAVWDISTMEMGQYLVGAKGTDIDGNTTWSFLSESEVSNLFGGHPNFANMMPEPGIIYAAINNNCGGVQQNADMGIQKTVNIPTPDVQSTIAYSLLLSNNGPDTATDILVKDLLPDGIFVAASSTDYSPISGEWYIQELLPDTQTSLQLTATVSSSSEGHHITNTAQIYTLNNGFSWDISCLE